MTNQDTDPSIPLKIKKGEQEEKKGKSLAIKLAIIVILLVLNGFLVSYIIKKSKPVKDNTNDIEITSTEPEAKDLGEVWVYNNTKMIFKDNTFIYYDNNIDYYEGTFEYVKGDQALEEMGYTEEDLNVQFGKGVNKENVYSMQLKPTKRVVNHADKSNVIKENTKWWFLLIVKDDNNALGYNKTLDERYDFVKEIDN